MGQIIYEHEFLNYFSKEKSFYLSALLPIAKELKSLMVVGVTLKDLL